MQSDMVIAGGGGGGFWVNKKKINERLKIGYMYMYIYNIYSYTQFL